MHFLLKSEVEISNMYNKGIQKRIYCPECRKTQVKKLENNDYYNKYHCWNKNCEKKNVPFVVLNKYIENEEFFNSACEFCQEPFHREFKVDENSEIRLFFKCDNKLCESNMEPYCYNLTTYKWENKSPKIIIYDDVLDVDVHSKITNENMIKKKNDTLKGKVNRKEQLSSISSDKSSNKKDQALINDVEDIPLLTMSSLEYEAFLKNHQDKVVVLVDVPNFIRTLRKLFSHDFEGVLKKAYDLLLQYIENSFHASEDYIIRYFSKPDDDLKVPNEIIMQFCSNDPRKEIFHLFKILKGAGYSDIDNYLIANGVEILERCRIKGFIIVSSDKDYLPVMRIASYKNVKSRVLGINLPEIYEEYHVEGIKFLRMMNYFKL